MLVKKELLTLPLLEPRTKTGYILEAAVFELPRSGEVLVADYYKDGKLDARFFSDGKGFLTAFGWPPENFRQAKPGRYYERYMETEASKQTISDFFGYKMSYGTVQDKIEWFIERLGREKREKLWDSRFARMEQHMAMFPALPERFDRYCEDHLFGHSYLFFSKLDKAGRRHGRCGSCGAGLFVKGNTKHNDTGVCPRCGKPVTFKGDWYRQEYKERKRICVAYKVDGQLLIRWVEVTRSFYQCKSRYQFEDIARNLHLNTKTGKKLYGYVYQKRMYGYEKEWIIRGNEPYVGDSFVYTQNLHEVFGPVYYNVDLKAGLEQLKNPISFHCLLNALRDSPVAEYLFKLGMVTLTEQYKSLGVALKGNERPSFSKCLGVSGQYRALYSKLDISVQEHRIIQACRQQVTEQDILDWRSLRDSGCTSCTVTEWLPQMTFRKFLNYFSRQKQQNPKETLTHFVGWYRDYIGMSREMNVDLTHKTVRFPFDLKEAHDRLLLRYNQQKNEIQDRKFAEAVAKIYQALPFTEYEKDGLCIRLPALRSDLITEGQSLGHCVGTERYYKNHIAGTHLIFFIRKTETPDKPYYTMELRMEDLEILQLYGFKDCAATKEVRAFANSMVRAMKTTLRRKSA